MFSWALAYSREYKTAKMPDGKIWFAENLNNENGTGKCYDDDIVICKTCGKLYDWNTAKTICPKGWHLPTDAEWTALEKAMEKNGKKAGTLLKAASGWDFNGSGTDDYAFSALPCGQYIEGKYSTYGSSAKFWSATGSENDHAWNRNLHFSYAVMFKDISNKNSMFSIRCVKD